jgi:hypothetical protein
LLYLCSPSFSLATHHIWNQNDTRGFPTEHTYRKYTLKTSKQEMNHAMDLKARLDFWRKVVNQLSRTLPLSMERNDPKNLENSSKDNSVSPSSFFFSFSFFLCSLNDMGGWNDDDVCLRSPLYNSAGSCLENKVFQWIVIEITAPPEKTRPCARSRRKRQGS